MRRSLTLLACLFVVFLGFLPWHLAEAARLAESSPESSVRKHCDVCRPPSLSETPPSTLEPYRQQRPREPHAIRPHRLPKGRYRITPYQRQARPSIWGRMPGRGLPTSQPIVAIDGDTLRVGADRVRLRGINAPELTEPGGDAARLRLEELLKEGSVRIVPHGQDVYGRTIADVFVDERNVAEVLKQEGYAKGG